MITAETADLIRTHYKRALYVKFYASSANDNDYCDSPNQHLYAHVFPYGASVAMLNSEDDEILYHQTLIGSCKIVWK